MPQTFSGSTMEKLGTRNSYIAPSIRVEKEKTKREEKRRSRSNNGSSLKESRD